VTTEGTPDDQTPIPEHRTTYLAEFDQRLRRWRRATLVRDVGLQSTWIIALLAGAGVPLVQSFAWDRGVASLLGFVVVVATGAERLFARTSEQADALDRCRRGLESERRMYMTATGPYTNESEHFRLFVERSEVITAAYDERSLRAQRNHAQPGG
jgi:hypothetical protein